MIQDISKKIIWIKKNPIILQNIFRGIERETLRIQKNGKFSDIDHPYELGSALTHKWITTDFSENLLEFITPKNKNIDNLLYFLQDLHIFVSKKNKNELMWPLSIPFFSKKNVNIKIANYGQSNIGKIKNLYRLGLKNRYGDMPNTIAGLHYNFSLPLEFWYEWNKNNKKKEKDYVSSGYLHLIRNYYRFGWIIPYLFGASPAISSYLIKNKNNKFNKNIENNFYLPWSTSLRLSDLGYTSTSIIDLNINFNNLESYIQSLTNAINTPSKKFIKIGLKNEKGEFQQLNTNILQIENELYTQIRPKRNTLSGESLITALNNRGIEYVEIRSLDVNPFSPIGINKNQILLLDLFLIWCALKKSPNMYKEDFLLTKKNWKKIIFEGRKPNQKIYVNTQKEKKTLIEIGKKIFQELEEIAKALDFFSEEKIYQKVCQKKRLFFYYPELTYSARCLKLFIQNGIKKTGLKLAQKNHKYLIKKSFHILNQKILEQEVIYSHHQQKKIEKEDNISFEEYLKK